MFRPLAAAALLLAPAGAWAQEAPPAAAGRVIGGGVPSADESTNAAAVPSPWSAAGPTAAVLGLIGVAAFAWKKTGRRGVAPAGPCEVLAKVRLEPRATVFVVRVGTRALVVGGGADGLRTLSEVADPAEAAALFAACRPAPPAGLTAAFTDRKPGNAGNAPNAGRESFRTLFGRAAGDAAPEPAPPAPEAGGEPAAPGRPVSQAVSAAERRLAARLRPAPPASLSEAA